MAAEATQFLSLLRRTKSGPTVLFYHGVVETLADPRVQSLHLPMRLFERQIEYLQRHFEIIALDDLYRSEVSRAGLHGRQIAITFDDGYRNNLTLVAPYLQARGLPFAVFVSTRHVSEGLRFPTYVLRASILYSRERRASVLGLDYDLSTESTRQKSLALLSRSLKRAPLAIVEKMLSELIQLLPPAQWEELNARFSSDQPMTWNEVQALHRLGISIGSHCHDHCLMHAAQPAEEVARQLRVSRELVQQHVGNCLYLAYPNGSRDDISDEARRMAEATGYAAAFTTIRGQVRATSDRYLVPRVSAETGDIHRFRYAVSANYQ